MDIGNSPAGRPSFTPLPAFKASPLPLVSDFYDWSLEQFVEPPERLESEKPGGSSYEARAWRAQHRETLIKRAADTYPAARTSRLDEQVAIFENQSELVSLMRFYSYEPRLAVADERDGISIYNLGDSSKISHFSNRNPPGTRITSLNLINEDDHALLMTASGTSRLFHCVFSDSHLAQTRALCASGATRPAIVG